MDIQFDIDKVFSDRLAAAFGLEAYVRIIKSVRTTNIAQDKEFQRMFNGFYVVRRNEAWRRIYYDHFEAQKQNQPSFENILTYLYEQTGNIEPSFSSKMLATITPEKPIWDRYVVQSLNLQLTGKTQLEKLTNAVALYAQIESWYKGFLQTEKATECIQKFDQLLPDYSWISPTKKIDCILWSIR